MIDGYTVSLNLAVDVDTFNSNIKGIKSYLYKLKKLGVDEFILCGGNTSAKKFEDLNVSHILVTTPTSCNIDELFSMGAEASSGDYVIDITISTLPLLTEYMMKNKKELLKSDCTMYVTKPIKSAFVRNLSRYIIGLSKVHSGSVLFYVNSRTSINNFIMFGDSDNHRAISLYSIDKSVRFVELNQLPPKSSFKFQFERALRSLTQNHKVLERATFGSILIAFSIIAFSLIFALISYLFLSPIEGWFSTVILNSAMFSLIFTILYFIVRLIGTNNSYMDKRMKRKPFSVIKRDASV